MQEFKVKAIGRVEVAGEGMRIKLEQKYAAALQGLEGFSHLAVLWWFSDFDNEEMRGVLQAPQPYKNAPDTMGIFATRSPIRPNPIALTTVQPLYIDYENGVIEIAYIDANNNTPVLDIKPYTPSVDRVENPDVPQWCAHWPLNYETSGDFAWEEEFNF
ncbi:MAG: SAM-dependent methyltransferase [Oscillospiraceae bacterium]